MYPDSIQYVMVNFEEATDEIYGYLLIDLNPTTNTTRLIRATVFPCDSVEETWNGIKEIDTSDSDHSTSKMSSCEDPVLKLGNVDLQNHERNGVCQTESNQVVV